MMQNFKKMIFFYSHIKNRSEISAHIFNDVFCEFEDKFYAEGSYKNAMANFKKYMKICAENRGFSIIILPCSAQNLIHGIKSIWSINYN